MKNCDYYQKSFSDLVEDTLDNGPKHMLQDHLQHCSNCREKLQQLRSLKNSLAALPRAKTSNSFDIVLHAKLRHAMRTRQPKRWSPFFFELGWKAPAYGVVALLLMFVGAQFQRITSQPTNYASRGNLLAIENALEGDMNFIDPGYMIVSVDSAKNTLRVFNYADLDRARTIEDYRKGRSNVDSMLENFRQNQSLPNLRQAPQNAPTMQTVGQRPSPQIRQAEFVF